MDRHFIVGKTAHAVIVREFDLELHPVGARNSMTREQAWDLANAWAKPSKKATLGHERVARRIDFLALDGTLSTVTEAAEISQLVGKATKAKHEAPVAANETKMPWE